MRLGLLGYPITHSLSPAIYQNLLGEQLESYKLYSYATPDLIPSLSYFAQELDGLNITSPYKSHFINELKVTSPLVKNLGVVNTLAFVNNEVLATNTDLLAVLHILKRFQGEYSRIKILLLGDGAMATVTKLVANELKIPLHQYARKMTDHFDQLDLSTEAEAGVQNIIINSCSRAYEFRGKVTGDEIFWDYNYKFLPHQNTLPSLVKSYQDGEEMLELQAREAINFWNEVNPKLK